MDYIKTTEEDLPALVALWGPATANWTPEDWDNDVYAGVYDDLPEDSIASDDSDAESETLTEVDDDETIDLAFGIGGLVRGGYAGKARGGLGGLGGRYKDGRMVKRQSGGRFDGSTKGPEKAKGLAGERGNKSTHTVTRRRAAAKDETTPNTGAKRKTGKIAKPKTFKSGYRAKPKAVAKKWQTAGEKTGTERKELARKTEGLAEARANRPNLTGGDKAAADRVAAAQKALTAARAAMSKAETARNTLRQNNAAEITAKQTVFNRANTLETQARMNVEGLVLHERAVKAGEAAKAKDPNSAKALRYQRMLDAEAKLKAARQEEDRLELIRNKSRDAAQKLFYSLANKYRQGQWGMINFRKMHREHPELKPLEAQARIDEKAYTKALNERWRAENTYRTARDSLALRYSKSAKVQKEITDAEKNHPTLVGKKAARDKALEELEKANGDAAVRTAMDARSKAEAELSSALMAQQFGTARYGYHDQPMQSALYHDLHQWSHEQLAAVRAEDRGAGKRARNQYKGDAALAQIQETQGFTHRPDLISARELEAHIRMGETEMWRGDTKQAYTDQLLTGEYHPGMGVFGNGTYAQEGSTGFQVARSYALKHATYGGKNASDSRIIRMTVKQGAKVAQYRQITQQQQRDVADLATKMQQASKSNNQTEYERLELLKNIISTDVGRYAAMRGFDAIHVENGQWVVLNRSALRISNQIFPGDYNGGSH